MRILTYVVIFAIMLSAYLSSPGVAVTPGFMKLLPDGLSVIVAVYVVVAGARQQFRNVDAKYWFIFGALGFIVACGPIVNQEAPGPIISGMRYYLRAVPLFFLPAVFRYEERDLRRYAALLLAFAILQLPVSISQRFTLVAEGRFTGDYVYGTLMISGILSMFLIAALCIIGALTIRGRIPKKWFAACFVLLVIPMSINETKASLVFLPLGLLITFYFASPPARRVRTVVSALGLLVIAAVIFVPLYNYYNTLNNPYPMKIADFFDSDTLKSYFVGKSRVGSGDEAYRGDALIVLFDQVWRDPVKLFFGVGLGNASLSSLGAQFSGQYKALYWPYVQTSSLATFLFEIGLLGTLLILALHVAVLRDAIGVMNKGKGKGLLADVAPGYIGAWTVITLGLFYLSIHSFEALSYLFFFFSGLLAARRVEMKRDAVDHGRHGQPSGKPAARPRGRMQT